MAAKEVEIWADAKNAFDGVDILANAAKATLGPKGRSRCSR